MFGPDYLVAPVTDLGARNWSVYLPTSSSNSTGTSGNGDGGISSWTHVFSNQTYAGGQTVVVPAPLDEFPLFKRQ